MDNMSWQQLGVYAGTLAVLATILYILGRWLVNNLMKWFMERMDDKDTRIDTYGEEVIKITNMFNDTTRQFQVIMLSKLDEWEKNREDILCGNRDFHERMLKQQRLMMDILEKDRTMWKEGLTVGVEQRQQLSELLSNLVERAQKAIEVRDQDLTENREFVQQTIEQHRALMQGMTRLVTGIEKMCKEFDIRFNGNNNT